MKKSEIKKLLLKLDDVKMPDKETIISECPNITPKTFSRKRVGIRPVLIMAATIILLALIGCAAEVKEYNDAVEFFDQYDLSKENLSRSEIKMVYRDIITEKFALEKTAVVIIDSYEGKAIGISKPSSEELKDIWNKIGSWREEKYSWYYLDNEEEINGIIRSGEMMFKKEENGVVLWETKIPLRDGYVEDYTLLSDGKYVAVYGGYSPLIAPSHFCGFVEIFDTKTGISVLSKLFSNYRRFSISKIIETEDGMALFCRADLENFVFIKMDFSGEILLQKVTHIGNKGIWDVAKLGDGYIVQTGGYKQQEAIMKVSSDGEINEGFSYGEENTAYFITDMMEFCGEIYLSAYAVPKNGREIYSSHDEITGILDEIYSLNEFPEYNSSGNFDENFAEMLRENYTAVLLVCDADSGIPTEFYSVAGSVGGSLNISESGEMIWESEYISGAYFSPATSSFSISGACVIYEHTFDETVKLVRSEKTDRVTGFLR